MNILDAPEAPAIVQASPVTLQSILYNQQEIRRTGAHHPIGRIMTVLLWPRDGERRPEPDTDVWGRSLEYGDAGPMLALSRDGFHLIVVNNFPLALPDTPRVSNPAELVKQRYADRTDKHLAGTPFVLFEPLRQILADPISVEIPGTSGARPPLIVSFSQDSFGQEPALLIHADTGEGYICGGAFNVNL